MFGPRIYTSIRNIISSKKYSTHLQQLKDRRNTATAGCWGTALPAIAMKHPGFRALALGSCLCLLYVGYELARACSLALFASRASGVNGAYTASGGFLLSIVTLAMYGRGVELLGAKCTLLLSTAGCCAFFLVFAGMLSAYESDAIPWSFVASLFVLRECYGSLIGTQIWALLSAELKERGAETSRSWFCVIQVRKTDACSESKLSPGLLFGCTHILTANQYPTEMGGCQRSLSPLFSY